MYRLLTLGGLVLKRREPPDDAVLLENSKSLLVLAVLATRRDRSARRDHLAELFWPEGGRGKGLQALRQALFYLRRHAPDVLDSDDESLTLRPGVLQVDLWDLDDALERADYDRVISLYQGRFVAGQEGKGSAELEHLLEAENSRLEAGVAVAHHRAVAGALTEGRTEDAVRTARRWVEWNPLEDERQRLLIETLRATGDELSALRAFESYRVLLERAAEDRPSPDLTAIVDALRRDLFQTPPQAIPPTGATSVSPPAESPTAVSIAAPDQPRNRRHGLAWSAAGVLTTAAVAALLLARAVDRSSALVPGLLAGVNARVLAMRAPPASEAVVLEIRDGLARLRTTEALGPHEIPGGAPGQRASANQSPDGWNLEVGCRPGFPSRVVTRDPGDELPLAWSPDARYVLYARQRLTTDGRTQVARFALYDCAADSSRDFSALSSTELPVVRWSPDGSQIALTADRDGAPEVYVVDFDLGETRNVSRSDAWDGEPAWSPDGERLAFTSRRHESADLFTVRRDGVDLRRVTQSASDERTPIWLTPTLIAYAVGEGGVGSLWVVDDLGRGTARLPISDSIGRLVAPLDPPSGWIASLRISPRLAAGSPGQFSQLTAEALDARGDPVATHLLPLRWVALDPRVLRVYEDGAVRFLRFGSTAIVATTSGWRADTLQVVSLPLVDLPVRTLFAESWRSGILPERWRRFGQPEPYTRSRGAPSGGGLMVNNGDEHFESGLVSAPVFPLADGLTIDTELRMGFTGKLHQVYALALYADPPPDSVLAVGSGSALVEFRVRGPAAGDPGEATITTAERRFSIPLPVGARSWHRYALQLDRDGLVDLLVDDRLYWRAPAGMTRRLPQAAALVLTGQSFETEIIQGPLLVAAGVRRRLPVIAPDLPAGRDGTER